MFLLWLISEKTDQIPAWQNENQQTDGYSNRPTDRQIDKESVIIYRGGGGGVSLEHLWALWGIR